MDTFNAWDAFNKSRAAADASNLAGLQQASGAVTMAGALHKLQLENQFRNEIAAAKTPEERSAVAAKYATPADIFKRDTESADQKSKTEATKELARGRLQQAATQFNQMMDLRIGAAKTTQEKLLLEQQKAQGMMQLQAEHAKQVGEANTYNFGIPKHDIATPQITVGKAAAAPVAGQPTTTIDQKVSPADIATITDPQERAAALAAMQGGQFSAPNPANVETPPAAAPAAPLAPVAAAPTPPPAAIPPQGDMRDVMASRGEFGSNLQSQLGPRPAPAIAAQLGPQTPVATAAAVAPPAAVAQKFVTAKDAPAGMSGKAAAQWARDQNKPSIAGGGELSPEATKLTVEQYLAGDARAFAGWARNQKTKVALSNELAKQANEQGIDGKLLAAIQAEFKGFEAGQRTIGTREAQLSIAADVTSKFVPIAIEASEKLARTDTKLVNDAIIGVLSRTSSPELRRFAAANNALVNVYARAINPQGVATVSDKDHAREILSTAFSKGDYRAGAEQLKVEVDTELASPGSVKRDMRARFTGKTETPPPQNRRSTDTSPDIQKLLDKYK